VDKRNFSMRSYRITVARAALTLVFVGPVAAAPPQVNSEVISPAIGMSVSQIQRTYSGVDCSETTCEFAQSQPQQLCPGAGPCDHLVLIIANSHIIGYTADLSKEDWTRSLNASALILGPAKKLTIGPSEHVKMRNDYWSWRINENQDLSYTATSGANMYGAPLDAHNIMLAPADAK
jgi:hypothetical protein